MENQSAVKVRFFKTRKLAYWRVLGDINTLRIKHLCNQMAMFNIHHHIRYCVIDFSQAQTNINKNKLHSCIHSALLKSHKTPHQKFHVVFPKNA